MSLTIDAAEDYDYVALEDPGRPVANRYKFKAAAAGWVMPGPMSRSATTVFFIPYLWHGHHVFRYRLRAETPGTYNALPASGFAMYAPEIQASSDGCRVQIGEPTKP